MLALAVGPVPRQRALGAGHCTGTAEPRKRFYQFSPIKCIFANCLPSAPELK